MKDKIQVGIVGLGWPGERHAEALRAGSLGHLYACADTDEARRTAFNAQFPTDTSFSGYDEMLADPNIEAVVLCLPNFLHFPATLAALQAGKHVMCEKPPTLNASEMKVLREESDGRGLIYMFSRQSRFSPALLAARDLVEEGRLGSVYFGKAIYIRSRGTPGGIGGWFTDKKRSGGGALIDIGVHALDTIWYLMGTPKPVSVSGQVFSNFRHLSKSRPFDVEDAAYGMIRFENDAVVQFEVSWAANLPDDIPPSDWTGQELINTIIYGTKATVRLNPFTLFEDRAGKLETVKIRPKGNKNPFELQMKNFLEAVSGQAEPVSSAEQAVELMEMLDAIYLSSSTGREVPLR